MRSIQFPKMFKSNSTNVVKEYIDCTRQNTALLLLTEKGELFGDPYFGIRLKRYLFEQNNYVLKDIIIDEIYTQLALFIPQLSVQRRDIDIIQDEGKGQLICSFKAINQIDFTTDVYSLVIYDEDEVA